MFSGISGTIEPECPQRRQMILPGIVGAVSGTDATVVTPTALLASADDAPGEGETKALAHATIHRAVTGAATAGRKLFVTATQTSVGAYRVTDWANSIAVN